MVARGLPDEAVRGAAAGNMALAAPRGAAKVGTALVRVQCGREETAATPDEVKEAPVCVVKVSAPWCAPCRACQPAFLAMTERFSDVPAFVLDVEAAQQEGGVAEQLLDHVRVLCLPTFIAFAGGLETRRVEGAAMEEVATLFASGRAERIANDGGAPPRVCRTMSFQGKPA